MKPDYYLVLPWHFRDEFLRRERPTIIAGTRMIFPLPKLEIVGKAELDSARGEPMSLASPAPRGEGLGVAVAR